MNPEEMIKARAGGVCLICGASPVFIGIFQPDAPLDWGAPQGKTRLFRYCLCKECQEKPQTPDNVEKIIRVELEGGDVYAAS